MWLCTPVSGSQDSAPSPPPPTKDLPKPRKPKKPQWKTEVQTWREQNNVQTNLLLSGHPANGSLLTRSDLYLTSKKTCVECPSECLLYLTVCTTFPAEPSEEEAPE